MPSMSGDAHDNLAELKAPNSGPSIVGGAARIGLLLHDFPAGGTERIGLRLANIWASLGRDVTILCGTEAGPARALVGDQVDVLAMTPNIPRSWGSRQRLGKAIASEATRQTFDVLVAPGNFHLPVMQGLAGGGAARHTALVCKISNPLVRPDRSAIGQFAFAYRTRQSARSTDRFVAMSAALRDEAASIIGADRVVAIAEPIIDRPMAAHSACRRSTAPIIICAARFVAQKRLDLAMHAFAALPLIDARLVMLGDGATRKAVEELAQRLGIAGRVTFVGHVADIQPWLEKAHALLLTSVFEGYPAVLVEAISAGVPVVTTRCSPAIDEILFDPSFGAATAATPAALAVELLRAIKGDGVREAPRAVLLQRHDAQRCASEWLDLLDQTVADKRR